MAHTEEYDVIIVGAGFAGGLQEEILEAGNGLGARVDSEMPIYQFSDPEVWKDWTFSEYYPGWKEIQAYFRYVDEKFDVSRDVLYNSRVASAHWNDSVNRWTVTTEDGRVFRAQFLSLCTGIGAKQHIPEFKGLDTFEGEIHHASRWPEEYDFTGKRAGVIGTGSTGVQIIQEIAPVVAHLTVSQRTPNLTLPMRQRKISPEEQEQLKENLYPVFYNRRNQTFSGLFYDLDPTPIADTTPEERTLAFEDHWEKGGLRFWLGNYKELFSNQAFNDEVYSFWRMKPSLEQRYYEVYSQSNVTLVDVSKAAIEEITPNGLKTSDGAEHKLDVLVLATGFDMVTGGIASIDIRGQDGIPIKEKWADGVQSYLGLASAMYPNRDLYPLLYARRSQTFAGFFYDFKQTPVADTTPEERALVLEDLWEKGGLCFCLGCYAELLSNREFNDEVYAFWRKKVRERITDPTLQEKLAPMKPPHPFGIRRPSLEQRYFEVFSQANVTLVDINEAAIEEIIPKGLKTSDGIEHELDVLVLATGFDMVTGGITSIDIRGQDGISIKEKWVDGVQSYFGLASATYPNMFWIYGPQSPSSFSNGPSSIKNNRNL
ncbi:hypothetical protein GGU10DRAFT_336880 [Lentinula aff. detonsa]|uniref:Cyclohexanone monooxygenase n=1 Tax=Lentinula aff. detonsa TaxID=2804958 RepID=A0AA38KLG7_9AGAR|nr:hypothetical protein GGU10DRAFT_336880 [Lentinula aff. detonsa]